MFPIDYEYLMYESKGHAAAPKPKQAAAENGYIEYNATAAANAYPQYE